MPIEGHFRSKSVSPGLIMLVDSALYAASNASINCLLATVYNVFKLFNILSGGILGRTKHGSTSNTYSLLVE